MLVRTTGIFAFLITLSIFLQDCKKTSPTIVKGMVVDFYTNEPLEGAAVLIYKWHKTREQYLIFTTLFSDINGSFEFVEEDELDFYIGEIRKNGYLPKQNTIYDFIGEIKKNDINEATIPLIPKDSWLNLQVDKVSSGKSKIFLKVISPILKNEIGISFGEVPMQKAELELIEGQSYSQFLPVASNEILKIYWDSKTINLGTAFRDSILVTRGDTSSFIITY